MLSKYESPKVNINFAATKAIVIAIVAVIIIGVVAYASVHIVPAGHRGVLLRWGAVETTQPPLDEGIHFVRPFADDVINTEVRTLKYEQSTRAETNDLQTVSTTVTVNYHPTKERVHNLYQNLGPDYEDRVIEPAIRETVKQVTATYNAEELITKRPLVKADIQESIMKRLQDFNVETEVISITDFKFSQTFSEAVEAKVEAEQRALEAENKLKRIKVEAKQREAESEGIADANIAEAKGEAKAINIINEALQQNPHYLEWMKTKRWDGKLPLVVGGEGATPFVEIPTEPRNP